MAGRLRRDRIYVLENLLQVLEDPNGGGIEDEYEEVGEDSAYEEEEEEEDDEEEEEEEEEDFDNEEEEPVVPPPPPLIMVSPEGPTVLSEEAVINQGSENLVEDSEVSPRATGGGETSSSQDASGREWNRSEIDGLFCPICMEAWTNGGEHQVCCLPCGHLYGASCVKRWLQQRKNSGKCPQCNRKCTLRDVRVIYAQQIVAIDQEIQKKVRSLETTCSAFEKKNDVWLKKEGEWLRREADLHLQLHQLMERNNYLKRLLGDTQNRPSGLLNASEDCPEQQVIVGHNPNLRFRDQGSSSNFVLQKELVVDAAKFFDVDASSRIVIIAQRLPGMGGVHVLTKMSLLAPHERENIHLPVNTKAVRDLRVAPHGRLALLASLGKKLSVISMETNNTVLSYDLPAAAWSCSWDLNSSHYVYTGLQNGMLLVFDMRQTLKPVESVVGLTSNPIHTMHSLVPDSTLPGVRSLITASSGGVYQWNFGAIEERIFLMPESENRGVCISLAYCPNSNDIVASFRPKVEMCNDTAFSSPTPVASSTGQGVRGSHILYKSFGNNCYQKLGSVIANVDEVRLPKSAIIDNHNTQFASTSEVSCEVILQELPSFTVVQHLKSQMHPIRDVKYTNELTSGILSCLSEDRLQLFSRQNS